MTPVQIQTLLQQHLKDAQVMIGDPMNDGVHLTAQIICPTFAGMNRVERHRKVYAILGLHFDSGALHALQMTLRSPEEAENTGN